MFNKIHAALEELKLKEQAEEQTPAVTDGLNILSFVKGIVSYVELEMAKVTLKGPNAPTTVRFTISCEHNPVDPPQEILSNNVREDVIEGPVNSKHAMTHGATESTEGVPYHSV